MPGPFACPADEKLYYSNVVMTECRLCPALCHRNKVVTGRGTAFYKGMIVGEAPGADEDAQGKPFVGVSGQLLEQLFQEQMLNTNDFYVTNILKCRPAANRDPHETEIANCAPHLAKQIAIVEPRFIVAVGKFAAASLLNVKPESFRITKSRGKWIERLDGIRVFPFLHPAYLLRNRNDAALWEQARADVLKLALAFAADVYEDAA